MDPEFWRGRPVFVTEHTGFKGGWLSSWLGHWGAIVTGYALPPASTPNLFEAAAVGEDVNSVFGDVRDADAVQAALRQSRPEVVFHLAAQSLVRESYRHPVETYATNVMGTAHVLDAIRSVPSVRAVVIVTSDKCYENQEWPWPYREIDRLGGRDPYSNSKACAELVAAAFRTSFLSGPGRAAAATARAGNVIGGGDWAKDRLLPDLLRAFSAGATAAIRHPDAVRPWQHVLDALAGYLTLAEALCSRAPIDDTWNFGPDDADVRSVRWVADTVAQRWGGGASWIADDAAHPHEAMTLRLDSSRARARLGWIPRLTAELAIDWTLEWHQSWLTAPSKAGELTCQQIDSYQELLG